MTTTRLAALLLAAAALAACGTRDGRSDHPADADSGQAAPATVPTPNNPSAPDSTTGVAPLSGTPEGNKPGLAGDSMSAKSPGGVKAGQEGEPRKRP